MRSPVRALTTLALILPALLPAASARATLRLGRDVIPVEESLALTVDPGEPRFQGVARIELRVPAAVDSFRLHALGLTLDSLVLRRGDARVALSWRPGPGGLLTVRTRRPLVPGAHTLVLGWSAPFDTSALALYRLRHGGEWYAFTQFEAIEARRAFPCWDEPDFKIPWRLVLRVPRADLVAANTPLEQVSADGAWQTATFEESPPMPSYLVAFAVGPFDTLSVKGLPGPGRILSPRGTRALGAEAAAEAGPLLAALERWFGRAQPYRKLDLVAVPEYAYGAMENPGLITFLDNILLHDRRTLSPVERRRLAVDMAHELAHLWFGDLVTMRWWDDLWLNESFAEWMGQRAVDEVFPAMRVAAHQLAERDRAFRLDDLPGAHAMRRPVGDHVDLDQLADALAYDKGNALLRMFGAWLGPAVLRDGVREYLRLHAWGNATGPELWSTLSVVSGRDVSGPMASFLDQPGVPEVTVEQAGGGRIVLSQRRYVTGGADTSAALWHIPVVLALWDGHAIHRQRVLLERRRQSFALDVRDPQWVHPDADEEGYYRWRVPDAMFGRIAAAGPAALTARERIALPGAAFASLAAGELDGTTAIHVLERVARDPEPLAVLAALDAAGRVRSTFADEARDPAYAGWLRRTFGPALSALGTARRAGESAGAAELRAALVWELGAHGGDAALAAEAARQSGRWLADPASVDPSLAASWLRLAARTGDTARFEAYRRRLAGGMTPDQRGTLVLALSEFRDPAAVTRLLDLALSGALRPQEVTGLLRFWKDPPELRARARSWVREHYDAIVARIPRSDRIDLVDVGEGCGDEGLAETRAFFTAPRRDSPGYREELAQLADRQRACGALRARAGDAVRHALAASP